MNNPNSAGTQLGGLQASSNRSATSEGMDQPPVSAQSNEIGWQSILIMRFAVLASLITFWQGVVELEFISSFWVSSPLLIAERLSELIVSPAFYRDLKATLTETALGLSIGVAAGVVTGFILAGSRTLYLAIDPFIMALYALPRIALAPLFILWLGIGLASKVVLAMFVAYFIILVNTYAGVVGVERELVDAVRTTGASRWFITLRVRLPSAIPWILAGIRLAAGSALPAAVVAEMLGSTEGIGHEIARGAGAFDTTGIFAYLVVLGAIAMLLNEGLKMLEARLLVWRNP